MRIVIISGTAPPEPMTAGRIHHDLAQHMAGENNSVWFISPKPSRPLGTQYQDIRKDTVSRIADNCWHVRINSFTYPAYNFFFRTYESIDFGIRSIRYVNRKIKDYDIIYVSPWAYLGQFMILVLRKNKKVPVIMNVQDLYPESFLVRIKSKAVNWLLSPLYLLDRYNAVKSTHITVISDTMKEVYTGKRGIVNSKISVIHNWQDESEFMKAQLPKEEILEKYKIPCFNGRFIFMYLGNIGPVAGVDTILNSFSKLEKEKSYLIIAGSGSSKDKCQLLARKLNITNLAFTEVPPGLKDVVELQSIADILLLPINPEAANSSMPSKLIAYMFSGKPVITSANEFSETAMAVKISGCGWTTKTNDAKDWIEVLELALKTNRETLASMGRSGFDYAIENYSKKEGLKRMSQLINRLTGSYSLPGRFYDHREEMRANYEWNEKQI